MGKLQKGIRKSCKEVGSQLSDNGITGKAGSEFILLEKASLMFRDENQGIS